LLRAKLSSVTKNFANAGLSAIPGESDIHAPILRLSLGRVVRSNGVRFAEALSRLQAGLYTFRREIKPPRSLPACTRGRYCLKFPRSGALGRPWHCQCTR
jgi:hypothetical protein